MVHLAISRSFDLSNVWWDQGLSKSAARDGNTYVLAIGEWRSSPYGGGLIIQPNKVQVGKLRRLGLLKEAWSIDVDLSMRKQGRLD
jgi:hypothetical protein